MRLARFLPIVPAALVVAAAVSPALASSHASIRLSPSRVAIGHKAKLIGSHVKPNTFFPVLIAVPNAKAHKAESFAGVVRSDKNGRVNASLRIPVFVRCGSAMLYILNGRSEPASTRISLVGCKASGKNVPPPPPPSHSG